MKKQFVLALAVLCFTVLIGVVPAQATYLDSSWYAQLTNVHTINGQPFYGIASNSAHITVTGLPDSAFFSISQSGQAPSGETARWSNTTLDENNTLGSISFDYKTYWTQPNLVLQLWSSNLMPWQPEPALVWSTSLTGLRSGHVTVNANPNGYGFRLVTVTPEPSSIIALGSLCASGIVLGLRRKISVV